MKVVVTGAGGFLGWHTRVALRAMTEHDVVAVDRSSWRDLDRLVSEADAVLHVAGVNRGPEPAVEQGNVGLARDVGDALRRGRPGTRLVFANSIHAGTDNAYGRGKASASDVLAAAARDAGSSYVDVRLPNLFGEHGRPSYNSFVATFADAIVRDELPHVVDRDVSLLHAQRAAGVLLDALTTESHVLEPAGTPTSVGRVLDTLRSCDLLYRVGDIPPLDDPLQLDLFNTLRSVHADRGHVVAATPRADHRGRLVEVVRAHGGQGQTFVSTTRPGITRGEHFHLRKVERFVVLQGRARIEMRRLFHEEVRTVDVDGAEPLLVDMPTMWSHNITNVGDTELLTLFWTHELFNPAAPDTFPEPVGASACDAVAV